MVNTIEYKGRAVKWDGTIYELNMGTGSLTAQNMQLIKDYVDSLEEVVEELEGL